MKCLSRNFKEPPWDANGRVFLFVVVKANDLIAYLMPRLREFGLYLTDTLMETENVKFRKTFRPGRSCSPSGKTHFPGELERA